MFVACRSELEKDWENYDMSELPEEVWWFEGSSNDPKSVVMEPEGQHSAGHCHLICT